MRSGELDRRIVLQSPSATRSATGAEVTTWADVATVWAAVKREKGGESDAAEARQQMAAVVFRIRWRAGVLPGWRVSFDGRLFDVADVRELGRREGLELVAAARAT